MSRKEIFVRKALKIHGNKYDYSKVVYKTCKDKVIIICPIHGEFEQTPDNHINAKQGCPKCGREKANLNESISLEEFIERARKVHGDKYDYSKVEYKGYHTKVCIICPIHGEFWQTPANHLSKNRPQGCPKCKVEKLSEEQKMQKEEFTERAVRVHGNKYVYSEVIMNGLHTKVKIYCPKCNRYFFQEPNAHLRGQGCPYCANKYLTTEDVINMFRKVHGDKYDYSKVEYKTMNTKVCIICPKHGEFWQTPYKHIKSRQGCPFCKESHLEEEVRIILEENKIEYLYDKSNDLIGKQRFDFYLPKYNIAIECQGIQHFRPSAFSSKVNGKENFEKIKKLDNQKYLNAKSNGIKIIYYTNLNYKTFMGEKIINNKYELINTINNL